MRVGYARVSTSKGEQLEALQNQRQRLEGAGVDRIVQDVQSGRESDRAGLLELIALIEGRKISEVVITRVDRLGRDAADTDAVIAFAAKRGVKITALSGGEIECETPSGFMMSRLMTTMAEVESRMLSLRIKDGLRAGRKRRRPLRGRAPWGYRIKPDKTALEPNPSEWPRAQRFLEMLHGTGWRMNPALDAWDAAGLGDIPLHNCRSVRAWLMNPVLRGGTGYCQQKNHTYAEIAWDTHEALISHELYESITERLEQNRRMWGHNAYRKLRLLTGLCRCGECGKGLVYAPGRTIRSLMCRQRTCSQLYKSTRESAIEPLINKALSKRALAIASAVSVEPPEMAELRSAIAALEAMNDPDLAEAIASKQQRMRNLHIGGSVDPELLRCLAVPDFWRNYSYDELTELYHGLVDRVVVRDKAVVEIRLRY